MLIDRFGRKIDYLRISVTDRCDLRCTYCIPKGFKNFEAPAEWLTFTEIEQVVRVFYKQGVRHFRLTGGEPLLRRHITELIAKIKAIGSDIDLSMTTNATQLAKHALDLRQAGLDRLNVSLDGLNTETVTKISGSESLSKVLEGLEAAKLAGFTKIKINMVPLAGLNDHEIENMITFCMQQGFILRLIETMPMGQTGRNSQGRDLTALLSELSQRYQLQEIHEVLGGGPARYWQNQDKQFTLGLITPISQHFCATCNRVRLAVDGTLYMCLGQNSAFPLRALLRQTCDDQHLEQAIREAIELKPEKHEFREKPQQIQRLMSMTGG